MDDNRACAWLCLVSPVFDSGPTILASFLFSHVYIFCTSASTLLFWPLTLLEPQSAFGETLLKFQVVCPQNGTAVPKGLIIIFIRTRYDTILCNTSCGVFLCFYAWKTEEFGRAFMCGVRTHLNLSQLLPLLGTKAKYVRENTVDTSCTRSVPGLYSCVQQILRVL